jgi:hypothetical protein
LSVSPFFLDLLFLRRLLICFLCGLHVLRGFLLRAAVVEAPRREEGEEEQAHEGR